MHSSSLGRFQSLLKSIRGFQLPNSVVLSTSTHITYHLHYICCLLCLNKLGEDFSIVDFTDGSRTFSGQTNDLSSPGITLNLQIVNDLELGEMERFVLDLTSPQLTDVTATPLEIIIANSFTVDIIDDDGRCCNLLSFISNKFCFSYSQF